MTPRIVFSPLSKSWYVVTRYREKLSASGMPYIVATTKYDVSDQMRAILSPKGKRAVKAGKPLRVEV
jgi:hypothetical protein